MAGGENSHTRMLCTVLYCARATARVFSLIVCEGAVCLHALQRGLWVPDSDSQDIAALFPRVFHRYGIASQGVQQAPRFRCVL